MMELQLKLRGQGSDSVHSEVEALRQEVRALRDTSTQYDLSFDAALQRMEHRVQGIERTIQSTRPDEVVQMGLGSQGR
jgi:hypothetical protein